MSEENQDLPLRSLGSDYKVEHYMLKLACLLEQQIFRGEVYVFIRNSEPGTKLILDLKDLHIDEVVEIDASKDEIASFLTSFDDKKSYQKFEYWTSKKEKRRLDYSTERWCVKVEALQSAEAVVCFRYHTKSHGSSISWFLDDDSNRCCLTTGSLVNNRTLLPSQDAPTLMATWQLLLQVPDGFNSVTTGDEEGIVTESGTYFYTRMLLPISTFAIAIGKWQCIQIPFHFESTTTDDRIIECRHSFYPCPFAKADTTGPVIPCRVFHSASTDPSFLSHYIPLSIQTICRILGRHVIPKLDFVIIPRTVACLGFASPGLVLISPSILFGKSPMLPRLGHEISHAWFGINIGPKNWNEEWISEGFATFMEDVIDLKMSKFIHRSELLALKALNRYHILKSDCHNVDSSLQCMSAKEQSSEANVVINGLNRDKMVSQIPYLKGYFFLIRVANIVGLDPLLSALRSYVEHFHGCLVTTAECVDFFSRQFQEKEQIVHLAQLWLHGSSLPDLNDLFILNRLDVEVAQHVQYWKRPTRSAPVFTFSEAMPDQVLALFDRMLELEVKISPKTLERIIHRYEPHLINADVYHRACELIVSQQCLKLLPMVRDFLLQHPAMGAYLYGELMLCERPRFPAVAVEIYNIMESKLDANFLAIIRDLIFPQMVSAWYMDDSDEDQRLEHQRDPPQPVDMKDLFALSGVLYWKLNVDTYEVDGEIDRIKKERGYVYEDVIEISPEKLPNYEEKLKIFFSEHLHTDEEIRFVLAGSGYFDVRDVRNDTWIRISVDAGDLIVLPAGIYHRFTLDSKNYIKAKRYFVGEPVWTPYNRPVGDDMPARLEYLASIQSTA